MYRRKIFTFILAAFVAVSAFAQVDTTAVNRDSVDVVYGSADELDWIVSGIIFVVATAALYGILLKTNDPKPFLDAISTVPAFIAQVLLMLRYREQWIMWLIVDIATLILWCSIGNVFMIMQYVFWTLNCAYGYYKWSY